VIVNYLDLVCVAISPHKADSPLLVDSDAVLALAVPPQLLQAVTAWDPQILDSLRRMEEDQLPIRGPMKLGRQAPRSLSVEYPLGIPIRKRANHHPQ
jgi:hypothetical protein